jgi:hypothetical protein
MKKWLLVLTGFLLLGATACVQAKVSLPHDETLTNVVTITASDLADRLEQGMPFLLYISSVTCQSCAEFRPILNEYIAQTGLTVLKIEADGAFPTDNDLIAYEYTPTLVLHDGSKVVFHINALDDPKPFSSLEQLAKFLEKSIISE